MAALASALADVFARAPASLPFAARFLTGAMLETVDEAALVVTGTAIGEAVEIALAEGRIATTGLLLEDAQEVALALAGTGARDKKQAVLCAALSKCTPIEARYLARAILGEMRVGAKEGIVEDAIAKAFGRTLPDVKRAAGLVSDVGELARLAAEDRLAEACVVIGRPVGFKVEAAEALRRLSMFVG